MLIEQPVFHSESIRFAAFLFVAQIRRLNNGGVSVWGSFLKGGNIPSWEVTYPIPKALLRMIFLPRWDVLVSWTLLPLGGGGRWDGR